MLIIGQNLNTIRTKAEALLDASKENGLEVNPKTTK
jgi:hypothetical protein